MRFTKRLAIGGATCLLLSVMCIGGIAGPLRVHPENPRYFGDDSGRVVYLTGSHTWLDLQDGRLGGKLLHFDYDEFLDFLSKHHHNFFRLWAWESPNWVLPNSQVVRIDPMPFVRSGPGQATDGGPKFDLRALNPAYFHRLRRRVEAAGEKNIYVGVMLFQGFSVARKSRRRKDTPWRTHPMNAANNINGIDGDRNGDGEGYEVHTLADPRITRIQEAYVRKVIDTLNDLDNVIYEISNESHGDSAEWQYHMIDFIHHYEKSKPKQHPVWMSFTWDGMAGRGTDADLLRSPAEAISPRGGAAEPPAADGSKVIIADTDHLWGIGGNVNWVWKCFTRGLNPIFMDPYRNSPHHRAATLDPQWDPVRRAMGVARTLAERIDLAHMRPTADKRVCSTGYCLLAPGKEYVVWHEHPGALQLQLPAGTYTYEWIDPVCGVEVGSGSLRVERSGAQRLSSPARRPLVLHVRVVTRRAISETKRARHHQVRRY